MFEAKDTLKIPMSRGKGYKKATKSNLLFFKTRCRSRSFLNIEMLTKEEYHDEFEGEGDNFYGYGSYGQRFEFIPKDLSVTKNYIDKKKLFEDILSPTVVTLTSCINTKKVRFMYNQYF